MTNLNLLNRNIENVAVVGQGFEPVHALWKQFEAVMANASVSGTSLAQARVSLGFMAESRFLNCAGRASREGERAAAQLPGRDGRDGRPAGRDRAWRGRDRQPRRTAGRRVAWPGQSCLPTRKARSELEGHPPASAAGNPVRCAPLQCGQPGERTRPARDAHIETGAGAYCLRNPVIYVVVTSFLF